jgi:hypothetical protein
MPQTGIALPGVMPGSEHVCACVDNTAERFMAISVSNLLIISAVKLL